MNCLRDESTDIVPVYSSSCSGKEYYFEELFDSKILTKKRNRAQWCSRILVQILYSVTYLSIKIQLDRWYSKLQHGKGLIDLLSSYQLTKQIGPILRRCGKSYQLYDFVPPKRTIRRSRLSMMHGTVLTKKVKNISSLFQASLPIFLMNK
jgi:hypothetical protein